MLHGWRFLTALNRSPPLWKMPCGLKTVVVFGSGDQKFSSPPKKRPPKILGFVWIKEFKSQKIHEDERSFTVSQTCGNRNHHMSLCGEKNAHTYSWIETTNCKFSIDNVHMVQRCLSNLWSVCHPQTENQKIAKTKRPSRQKFHMNWFGLHEMFNPISMYPGCGGSPSWDIPVPKKWTWRFFLGDRFTWKMVIRQPIKHGCTSGI